MDWSKYPLYKLSFFVAGVIPGFVALLIYQVAVPGSFAWFFHLCFLGYRMKLTLIILTAFVIGNSMTRFLYGTFAMVGGVIGRVVGRRPYKPPHTVSVAPWRDTRWRVALKKYLGNDAPKDTILMSQDLHNLKLQMANQQPPALVQRAIAEVENEKLSAEIDDLNWSRWYDHFHSLVLTSTERDFAFYVERGLHYNLQTASVYVLISACFVPILRYWWVLTPTLLWTFFLLMEEYGGLMQYLNKYSTTSKQITYLSELSRKG